MAANDLTADHWDIILRDVTELTALLTLSSTSTASRLALQSHQHLRLERASDCRSQLLGLVPTVRYLEVKMTLPANVGAVCAANPHYDPQFMQEMFEDWEARPDTRDEEVFTVANMPLLDVLSDTLPNCFPQLRTLSLAYVSHQFSPHQCRQQRVRVLVDLCALLAAGQLSALEYIDFGGYFCCAPEHIRMHPDDAEIDFGAEPIPCICETLLANLPVATLFDLACCRFEDGHRLCGTICTADQDCPYEAVLARALDRGLDLRGWCTPLEHGADFDIYGLRRDDLRDAHTPLPPGARLDGPWGALFAGAVPTYFDVAYIALTLRMAERILESGHPQDDELPESEIIDQLIEAGGEPSDDLLQAARSGRLHKLYTAAGNKVLTMFLSRGGDDAPLVNIDAFKEEVTYHADMHCNFLLQFHELQRAEPTAAEQEIDAIEHELERRRQERRQQ